ncbi:MAG: sigma-54-dependent Fis family transcriptional regulator [Oligoflexia bacterium]|nr:sigma-54-dependent Fis family transcriptional regulator [Oligoflexia bacterium]
MKEVSRKFNILVIEDDEYFRRFLSKMISPLANIIETDNEEDAINQINKSYFDIVIIDINLHGKVSGFNILKNAKNKNLFSIMLTDQDDDESITKSYKLGCNHYLTKDQCENVLRFVIRDRLAELREHCSLTFFQKEFITQDQSLIFEISTINKRLLNNKSLLILGEHGVGKTKIAELIHDLSGGKADNFISLNAADISDSLLESELFGHVKGAFAGAEKDKKGLLQMADGGTLFLDEITSMPLSIQAKLLKCLDEKHFYPCGSIKPIKTRFRLMTSTCDDIYKLIQENRFKIDLFYRINGLIFTIPPLRERIADIPLLVKYFLKSGSRQIVINENAIDRLKRYSWPGNIRELKTLIEQLSSSSSGIITIGDLPYHIQHNCPPQQQRIVKKFITEEQVNYTKKHGVFKLLERIQTEIFCEFNTQLNNRPMDVIRGMKTSRSQYYKLLTKVQELKNELTCALPETYDELD